MTSSDDYSDAIQQALAAALLYRDTPRESIAALRAEIEEMPAERRLLIVNHVRFAEPALVEALIEEAAALRTVNAGRVADLSRLALQIAQQHGMAISFRTLAKGELGNALRVLGDHGQSRLILEEAMGDADGCADERVLPRILSFNVSQWLADHKYEESRRALNQMLGLALESDDMREVATCLAQLAEVHSRSGRPQMAIEYSVLALRIAPLDKSPLLLLIIVHNSARYLLDAGLPTEALATLRVLRGVRVPGGWQQAKGALLIGQIMASLGHDEVAVQLMRTARDRFADERQVFEVVYATLDLAAMLAVAGQDAEVIELARQAMVLAAACGADIEVIEALRLLLAGASAMATRIELASAAISKLAMRQFGATEWNGRAH